jgi:hypothetical protein
MSEHLIGLCSPSNTRDFLLSDNEFNTFTMTRFPYECGKVYIGQTGRSIRHMWLDQQEKSAVAENSINTGHQIDFSNVSLLDRASGYMDRLVKEAIQIRLNHKNFSRDNGLILRQAWNPVTNLMFKHHNDPGKAAIEQSHRPVA